MPIYAILWFKNFSPYYEKCYYAFECVTHIPETFTEVDVPTRDGIFKGIVVDITTEPKYQIGVYKI